MQQKDFKMQCLWAGGVLVGLVCLTGFLFYNQQQVKQSDSPDRSVVVETSQIS